MLISIGNFLFKWRDKVFPLGMLAMILVRPAQGQVFGLPEELFDVLGVLAMLAGEGLRIGVVGLKYIKRGGLGKRVYADDLVTEGFFSVCRNPLYVGNILISLGALMVHAQPVLMVVGGALTLFVYIAIVAAEEQFLANKFGPAYASYCADVNRWVPALTRLPAAAEGMTFNLKRVLVKEYTTVAAVLFGITLLLSYESWLAGAVIPWAAYGVGGVVALFVVGVRVLKKSGRLRV